CQGQFGRKGVSDDFDDAGESTGCGVETDADFREAELGGWGCYDHVAAIVSQEHTTGQGIDRIGWEYQFKQVSKPPPSANPFTAARTGFFPFRWLNPRKPEGGWFKTASWAAERRSAFFLAACSVRSCPAQKAWSPAPVMIATRREGSSSNQENKAWASQWASEGMELRWLGRLMVTSSVCGLGKERRKCGLVGGFAMVDLMCRPRGLGVCVLCRMC